MPTPNPICTVGGMLLGVVGCIASVAAAFVVEGKDPWSATDCVVGWTKTVVKTVTVDTAVVESVVMPVLSEATLVDAEMEMVTLGIGDG
jgi:hypothetical protein